MMSSHVCQSCSWSFREDHAGTEKDGRLSALYCRYCYEDGQFAQADLNLEGMIEFCVPFLVEEGMTEVDARAKMTAVMPGLKRWSGEVGHSALEPQTMETSPDNGN